MSLHWFADINLRLKELLRWPLETTVKVSPLNFTVRSNRQSTVRWGHEKYMCGCLSQKKIISEPMKFVHTKSRGLWSKHVLLKYINMLFDRSIRIVINPSQFTVPVSFFFWNSPSLWPPAIPTLHGPVSLSIPDKFRGGHITKHETIRFPLKGSWNFELNQRLRGMYESLTNQENENYPGKLKQREFNSGNLLHLWWKSYEAK